MKKIVSVITCIMLCAILAIPVSAAEISTVDEVDVITENSTYSVNAGYFRKITPLLNSVNGKSSDVATLSSGSISGNNPKITSVSLYVRVSSGSDSFYVYVKDPNKNTAFITVSSSGTYDITDFNGLDPSGDWQIWIVTKGTVSTATITMTVNYM